MHDNARFGGDGEYRSALSLPFVDDLKWPWRPAIAAGRDNTVR